MSTQPDMHRDTLRAPLSIEPDFCAVFEAMPGCAVLLDAKRCVVAINDAYLAVIGQTREAVIGQSMARALCLREAALAQLTASVQQACQTHVPARMTVEDVWLLPPPSIAQGPQSALQRLYDVVHTPVRPHKQAALYVIQSVTDITHSAEMQRQKEHACAIEAQKVSFFTNISHELRTPLALILGPTQTLRQTALDRQQQHDVDVIARNAQTLAARVDDLLDAARLEAGQLGLLWARLNVAALVRLVAAHFAHRAAMTHIHLSIDAPEHYVAEGDYEKLKRALINVLANAFAATPEGGHIRVSLRPHAMQDWVAIHVGDSGPGISKSARERVFMRFCQAPAPAHQVPSGTGLGLTITQDLLRLHGGQVAIDDAPEGGALLTLAWPIKAPMGTLVAELAPEAQCPAPPTAAAPAAAPEANQPLILVVEDNADMAHFIAHVLTPSYRVICVRDAYAAVRRARAIRPDLILSDMNVPKRRTKKEGLQAADMTPIAQGFAGEQFEAAETGGEALLGAVRSTPQLDSVPLVFLTAIADDSLRLRMLREGAQDYILKPFYADELRSRLGTLIGVDRARQLLQAEAASGAYDLEVLAAEVTTQRRRAAFLADVSRHLADSLDYDTTLERISRLALPTLADFCVIDIVDEHRSIKRVSAAHSCDKHDALVQALLPFGPAWDDAQPSAQVLRQGRPWLADVMTQELLDQAQFSPECRSAIEALHIQTFMAVPMRAHGRTLGVICLGGTQVGRHFNHEDLEFAEAMAERAAFALDSARLYRDAQTALASRDDFLLIAAHELRTPLTSLMLQIHTTQRRMRQACMEPAVKEALQHRMQCLSQQSERIAHLIDAMLDVACIASGHFAVHLAEVDFVDVVREVLNQLETSGDLARSHCDVRTQTPKKIMGQWDRIRLEQLLHHLLANAIKYGAGQPVHILLHESDKEVTLTVQDRGIGIDEGAQSRIFERFARAISTHNYGGLGVGLYVVRQIAEAMGGRIGVQSQVGGGATFTVVLPRSRSQVPAAWPAPAPKAAPPAFYY